MTVDPHDLTLLKGPRKGVLFERRPGVTLPAVAHHVSGHYRLPRNFPGDGRFASTARAPDLPSESPCDSIPCRKVSRGLAGSRGRGSIWLAYTGPCQSTKESDNALSRRAIPRRVQRLRHRLRGVERGGLIRCVR